MTVSVQDLRSISVFADLADPELGTVRQVVSARDYAPHSLIFTQGEPSPGLWFVRRGRVRLYRVNRSGREFTLCIARPDNFPCLGGCPLMDGDVSPVSAEALEPTCIYFIERQRALQVAGLPGAMARLLACVLANHTRYLSRVNVSLALRCSMARLVELLLTYMDERGRVTAHGIELDLDVTHELLASMLGTTPQTVAVVFLKLERTGMVEARGKHVVVLEPERLAQMV